MNPGECQTCESRDLYIFLDLGLQPACIFLSEQEVASERRFPLRAAYCRACGLVQLAEIADPGILFGKNYHHLAALSASFKDHLRRLAALLNRRFRLTDQDLVVELGSNDGALLEEFLPLKVRVLGVDPSDVAPLAEQKGVRTISEFFDERLAETILKDHGRATVIVALNTFAHVDNLHSILRGIKLLLDDRGVFVSESHSLADLISGIQYDFIYHEHFRYYSLEQLVYLFERHELEIFDAEKVPAHAGSLRVFAAKKRTHPVSPSVGTMLEEESAFRLREEATYKQFADEVQKHRRLLPDVLSDLRAAGRRIVGVTFPARAVTLLNACGIGSDLLDYISEQSTLKIGKLSPAVHIPVRDQRALFEEQPEYGLLLSWHIRNEIVPKFRAKGYLGKFIIPLPAPQFL